MLEASRLIDAQDLFNVLVLSRCGGEGFVSISRGENVRLDVGKPVKEPLCSRFVPSWQEWSGSSRRRELPLSVSDAVPSSLFLLLLSSCWLVEQTQIFAHAVFKTSSSLWLDYLAN